MEETISLEYLQKCHDYHDKWMDKMDECKLIDANIDMNLNPEIIKEWINIVKKMVKSNKHVEITEKVEFIDL